MGEVPVMNANELHSNRQKILNKRTIIVNHQWLHQRVGITPTEKIFKLS